LKKAEDLSVTAGGDTKNGTNTSTAATSLTGIRGSRLEALTDTESPKNGPGRAPDGNFVLSEIEVWAAPQANPDQKTKIQLVDARSDYDQGGYEVAKAIDGNAASGNGWAIGDKTGENHYAVFAFAQPAGLPEGTIITVDLQQNHQGGKHSLGRFRLSLTNSADPLLLNGISPEIVQVLEAPAADRSEEQRTALLNYYRSVDTTLHKHQQAVADSRLPRPIDPVLKAMRENVEIVSRPVPIDPGLQVLRQDVKLSTEQLAHRRLTAAQDIAWALINSPSFMFNR
jgi:hypothetical protein